MCCFKITVWRGYLGREILSQTLAVSDIPEETPSLGVEKQSWISILVEPSDDWIPNYHFSASPEDPKPELPSWAQSTHSLWERNYLKPLKFGGKLLCSNNGKILFPRALVFGMRLSLSGNWWLMTVPEGKTTNPWWSDDFPGHLTASCLLLRSSCPGFLKYHEVPQYLSNILFLASAKNLNTF